MRLVSTVLDRADLEHHQSSVGQHCSTLPAIWEAGTRPSVTDGGLGHRGKIGQIVKLAFKYD